MHVVDERPGRDNQREMLHQEVDDPMLDACIGHPDSPVLGNSELPRQDGEVDILEFMRIDDRVKIDVWPADAGNQ